MPFAVCSLCLEKIAGTKKNILNMNRGIINEVTFKTVEYPNNFLILTKECRLYPWMGLIKLF